MGAWSDGDDPRLRKLIGWELHQGYRYQDGRDGLAPSTVFADADYEKGDGTVGLHGDLRRANEPAIVYVRADALVDAAERIEQLEAEVTRLRDAIDQARDSCDPHYSESYWTGWRDCISFITQCSAAAQEKNHGNA